MKRLIRSLSLIAPLAAVTACFDMGLDAPPGMDGGTDTDSDGDTDTDADADTDTGSDTETDVDSDAGTDTDTDEDTESLDCDGGRYDSATGLCWQHPKASGTYLWMDAIDYCDGLDLGGHAEWGLPNRDDFIDLLGGCDSSVTSGGAGFCNTCAESATCSVLFGWDTDWHWSSSPADSEHSWSVGFGNGNVDDDYTGGTYYGVRCVRAGP